MCWTHSFCDVFAIVIYGIVSIIRLGTNFIGINVFDTAFSGCSVKKKPGYRHLVKRKEEFQYFIRYFCHSLILVLFLLRRYDNKLYIIKRGDVYLAWRVGRSAAGRSESLACFSLYVTNANMSK